MRSGFLKFHPVGNRQKGATMIETVIALFLMVIGLLGTLAMQTKGVNSNKRAQFATDANIIAEDMANRILAYMKNTNPSEPLPDTQLDDYSGINSKTSNASDPGCADSGCNAAQQLSLDEWQWVQSIQSRLPDGIGQVAYAAGTYTITVMWNNDQIENPTTNCSGAGTDLACFTYELKLE